MSASMVYAYVAPPQGRGSNIVFRLVQRRQTPHNALTQGAWIETSIIEQSRIDQVAPHAGRGLKPCSLLPYQPIW